MNLSGSQIMKLRRYGIRLVVWGLIAFVGFKGYQTYQEVKRNGIENQARKAAYERENRPTEEERKKIDLLIKQGGGDRAYWKHGGQLFSFPSKYYFNEGMMLYWFKDGEFAGHLEVNPKRKSDEEMRIFVYPKGVFLSTWQEFNVLLERGTLVKQDFPRKGVALYQKPDPKMLDIENYYVLNEFKDFEGNRPAIKCGSSNTNNSFAHCRMDILVAPNVFISVGDLTTEHVANFPEIYQAIMSVANQIEEIK